MIRKLVLEDFMAHGRTELVLGPGLTVLTGPNNTGKSALVEGLRCLAANPTPKWCIRHGAKQARVEAHLDDGAGNITVVAWVRKKASAIYELTRPGEEEPTVYAKLGRGKVPEDVLDALRLDLVNVETGQSIDVHVGNQREPVFLINQPPSVAAAFFAASTESAHLLGMHDLLKNKTIEAKREEKRLEARLSGLEVDLDRLDGLPDIALAVEDLAGREMEVEAGRQALPVIENTRNALSAMVASLDRAKARGRALARLAAPATLYPAPPLARTLERGQALDQERERLARRLVPLGGLQAPPRVAPVAGLLEMITRLQGLESVAQNLQKRQGSLVGLSQPPTIRDMAPGMRLLERLARLETEQARLVQRLEGLEQRRVELEREIKGLEGRVCPLCGGRIDAQAFLGDAGEGGLIGGRADAGQAGDAQASGGLGGRGPGESAGGTGSRDAEDALTRDQDVVGRGPGGRGPDGAAGPGEGRT